MTITELHVPATGLATTPIPVGTPTQVAEFFSHVAEEGDGPCRLWLGPGSVGKYGHTRIWFAGVKVAAHRVAYTLYGGVLAPEELVLHHCDNGRCVSEICLHTGTIQTNVMERELRNRRTSQLPTGSAHWSSKLSEDDVRTLRRARTLGHRAVDAAALWNVSPASVYAIWRGDRYCEPVENIARAS